MVCVEAAAAEEEPTPLPALAQAHQAAPAHDRHRLKLPL